MLSALHSCIGVAGLIAVAWLASEARGQVRWKEVLAALVAQLVIALAMFGIPGVEAGFDFLNRAVGALSAATQQGGRFVFGFLAGGDLPFAPASPGARSFVLAFETLPVVIVISALTAILTHWRVLPALVLGLSRLLEKTLGIGGAVGLGVGANIFLGMVESPLFIRAYLRKLSRSELFTVMTAGMATVAGTVLALYALVLGDVLPGAAGHLLTASLISAPAAILFARLMVPETAGPTGGGHLPPSPYDSTMEALTQGTSDGLKLFLNIIAMLLVFVSLVALVNIMLSALTPDGRSPLTFEGIVGVALSPLAWLCGIPWAESVTAGALLGKKVVLNEFLAYLDLAGASGASLSDRSRLILTYALCGFANFGSLGIMLAGFGTLVPERRREVAELGLKSILAGLLATCCTGALVGLLSTVGMIG
jgi:CNT family concentrative nucleoside transporter